MSDHQRDPVAIVAALVLDDAGRVLLVRKAGTSAFMQPGGTLDVEEDQLVALARELRQELGCGIVPGSATYLGCFFAAAANEVGRVVQANIYRVTLDGTPTASAEIAELRWVDPAAARTVPLAPLTDNHALPLAAALHRGDPLPERSPALDGWLATSAAGYRRMAVDADYRRHIQSRVS